MPTTLTLRGLRYTVHTAPCLHLVGPRGARYLLARGNHHNRPDWPPGWLVPIAQRKYDTRLDGVALTADLGAVLVP